MSEEAQYAAPEGLNNKRKYEDQTTPSPVSSGGARRVTGFSAPILSQSDGGAAAPPPSSYNSVPPPMDDFQLAKQKAQEIAARLLNDAEAKKPRVDNGSGGGGGYDSYERKEKPMAAPVMTSSYGYPGPSKKIEIPNGRVGVIIGKAGETIKYLQLQSGAKIQVTRDMDADPNSPTRAVELMGTPEQIAKAEQLINDVLSEADVGGSGDSRRVTHHQSGGEQFVMKVPNNKVGLVIGKGGETIKSMQARTGARIQVIPLHLPPGDTSAERTVQIDGSSEQIEAAKQLVNEVISENRVRNPGMSGGYSQQGYQARPPTSWAPPGAPAQQPGYGYLQPGAYPGPSPQYNASQPQYPGYPPQPAATGYASGWGDQTTAPNQQSQAGGYDYYSQQAPPQQQQTTGGPAASTDNSAYYNQQSASGYSQGQAYSQDGYGYPAPAPQSGYQGTGYDQQQGYSSTPGYGNASNPASEVQNPSYGSQGDGTQAPPPVQSSATGQQGYQSSQQPSPNPSYPTQGSAQAGYGMPPASQGAYGTQPPAGYAAGYGAPQGQKLPTSQPAYGQPQQSPSAQGGYAQPPSAQPGYPQPPAQSGYAQADSGSQQRPSAGYGAPSAQPGYGAQSYGAPTTQPGYGQQQPPAPYNSTYAGGYSQPPAYASDGSAGGSAHGTYDATPASQSVQPSAGVAKASPQS